MLPGSVLYRNFLLLIKSVITSKAELAGRSWEARAQAVGRDGDQENLRLQAPIAMT